MKIIGYEIKKQTAPLKTPFCTALRRVEVMEAVVLILHTDEGLIGYGSASPTAAVTGETIPSIVCALNDYILPNILQKELSFSLFESIKKAIARNTSAKCAAEIAVWDLLAKAKGVPLYSLLGAKKPKTLETFYTISLDKPQKMYSDALTAIKDGLRFLKIKVGGSADEDIARIDAVCETRPAQVLLDANQAWNFDTAVKVINHCSKKAYPVKLIEQPFPARQLALMKKLREVSPFPILADESVFDCYDAKRVIDEHAADMINIKLAKAGGISEALRICDTAEQAGISCMIGCMLESPIGVIAAAHLAAAKSVITTYDLDAVELLANNPIKSDSVFSKGRIALSFANGLGLKPVE